jgi:hypothetical protein
MLSKNKFFNNWFFEWDMKGMIRESGGQPKTGVWIGIDNIPQHDYDKLRRKLLPIREVFSRVYDLSDVSKLSEEKKSEILKRIFYYCEYARCQKLHMLYGLGIKLSTIFSSNHGWECKEVERNGDCLYSCVAFALNHTAASTHVRNIKTLH